MAKIDITIGDIEPCIDHIKVYSISPETGDKKKMLECENENSEFGITNNFISIMDDRFQEYYKWYNTFRTDLIDFHSDPMLDGMKPINQDKVIPDGDYFTIRCGLGGIYTNLDEVKNGIWQCKILDASKVIAYRPLTTEEQLQSDFLINKIKNKNE